MTKLKSINSFWHYFTTNSSNLLTDGEIDWSIWQELSAHLRKINSLLKLEVTIGEKSSKPTLTISADGFKKAISTVQEIYDNKPQIDNWKIEKFRQPITNLATYSITLDNMELQFSQIFYFFEPESEENIMADIILFLPNYIKNSETNDIFKWLILDAALGEFITMTKIRSCAIESIDHVNYNVCKNIIYLKEEFEKFLPSPN